jgi:FkbM family methyltransferase
MTASLPEGNTFYYYGYCEANLTNFFLRYLSDDMVLFDIGAHVGFYSMLGSALLSTDGQVHSFEPTPSTFATLTKNTSGLTNVTRHNVAMGSTVGTTTFSDYGPGYSAYNTATPGGGQGISRTPIMISIPVTTLDTVCRDTGLMPDVIKIDAEGFEPEILKGATSLLSLQNPSRPLLTLEVAGGEEWAENRAEAFHILNSNHYLPYTITTDGYLVAHTLQAEYTYDNLLFVPAERENQITPYLAV